MREEVFERLNQLALSTRIAAALAGRFREVIVDEAQDCNPHDLKIISWLRDTKIPVKVVCDPHQSIYGFRGGVTDHLFAFENTLPASERIELTGNFRSSPNICKAIAQFRPPKSCGGSDDPLCPFVFENEPIHIFSYAGRAVPASIGKAFSDLLRQLSIDISSSPILAATIASGAAAVGQPRPTNYRDRTVRLAEAVMSFHFAAGFNDIKVALGSVHEIALELEGHLAELSYHQYLSDNDIEPASWRPKIIALIRELRFDPDHHQDAKAWHAAAKITVERHLNISHSRSISQELKWNAALDNILAVAPDDTAMPRTIHSVKGMEFSAVCVVTTAATLKSILDFLEKGSPAERAEDARKLYVAASRAQRLLVIASPKSQAERLKAHLSTQGAEVTVTDI